MTFGFALAGLTHDYHILSFKVVVATLLVPSHDDKPVGVSSSVAHASGKSLPLTPIHIKLQVQERSMLRTKREESLFQRLDRMEEEAASIKDGNIVFQGGKRKREEAAKTSAVPSGKQVKNKKLLSFDEEDE